MTSKVTPPNSAVPALLTTLIDPDVIKVLFSPTKPRDRSHYERFASYHETFYRCVEASSVTP